MDKSTANAIRLRITALAEDIAKEFGVSVQGARAVYDDNRLKLTLEMHHENDAGLSSAEEEAFRRFAPAFGISPDAYGMEFISNERLMVLCGYNGRARRFPFIAQDKATGARYKYTSQFVQKRAQELGLTTGAEPVA
jgi:hypothetical protein